MALVSAASRGDATAYREAGVSAYLSKPATPAEMLALVAGEVPEEILATRHWLREHRKRLSVLVADDSRTNQVLASRLLEKRGHRVVAVGTGTHAVAAAEKDRFDVILMDVQMPEMDGLEATARIREREALVGGHVPIVALTAHANESDRERCLAAGMDDYISKPFSAEDLHATLEHVARRFPQDITEDDVPAADRYGGAIDHRIALEQVDGNHSLLVELATSFVDAYDGIIGVLEGAVTSGDHSKVEVTSTHLAADLSAIGALDAASAARALSAAARFGGPEALSPAFGHLHAALQRLEPEVTALSISGVAAWGS